MRTSSLSVGNTREVDPYVLAVEYVWRQVKIDRGIRVEPGGRAISTAENVDAQGFHLVVEAMHTRRSAERVSSGASNGVG